MQKIFNYPAQQDSNELPLRRRMLYPTELLAHISLPSILSKNKMAVKWAFLRNVGELWESAAPAAAAENCAKKGLTAEKIVL